VGLAGKTSANNVNWPEFDSNGSDIVVAPHVGPMCRENSPTPRIDLHLPADLETGPFEAEIEAADPGEETPDGQGPR
jgi:hypothetical protein